MNIVDIMKIHAEHEVKNVNLDLVKQTHECIIIIRKSDNKRFTDREFNRVCDAKNHLRQEFIYLKHKWADEVHKKAWWNLTWHEQHEWEKMSSEVYKHLYTLFEFKKVTI